MVEGGYIYTGGAIVARNVDGNLYLIKSRDRGQFFGFSYL